MNSKEIIERTLNFSNPARVGHSYPESDLVFCEHRCQTYATDWKRAGEKTWARTDDWGNLWQRLDATSKGEVVKGVLNSIDDINTYQFPDFSDIRDYETALYIVKSNPDKWIVGTLPGFAFNIASKLFKLENYLCDLMLETETIHQLHDTIDQLLIDMINGYASAGVDSVMLFEDWGTQQQLLINPSFWHEEFFPRFKKLCAHAHGLGLKVFMHSCGAISAIVPGLIEAGVDVLQFDQPALHDLDRLASYQASNKITYWCPVDIQRTLQTKDKLVIQSEAKEMLDKLWRKRGGFIAGYYSDNDSIGVDPIWQIYASEAFETYGQST